METRPRPTTRTISKTPLMPWLRWPVSEHCALQPTRSRSPRDDRSPYFWQRRTNVWRKATRSARAAKRPRSVRVVFRYTRRQMTKEEQVVGLIFQVTMWAYIAAAAAYVVIGWRHDCDLHALLEMSDHCAVIRFLPPITISCAI